MSIEEVLVSVRKAHGDSYALVGRLDGGYQGGAYLVTRNGKQAVLKWWENLSWATQVLRAAPVVQKIREQGYPTPAWLVVGTADRGFPYQVQEFVDGNPLPVLDDSAADLLLDVVDRQAKLNPDPDRSWSDYSRGVVFDESRSHLMASGDAGAAVVDALDRLCRPLHDLPLPADDMVHGDRLSPPAPSAPCVSPSICVTRDRGWTTVRDGGIVRAAPAALRLAADL